MPIYEYEHLESPCQLGDIFELTQSVHDEPITQCPECGGPVRKLLSPPTIQKTYSNSELREKGFTKLVRRDKGVYENVTAGSKGKETVVLKD